MSRWQGRSSSNSRFALIWLALIAPIVWNAAGAFADRLDDAIGNPPATGLMVLAIHTETPAGSGGLMPGDVITAYGGTATADLDGLSAAEKLNPSDHAIPLTIVRGDQSLSISVEPGLRGVDLCPVKQHVRLVLLPPDTGADIDLTQADLPQDQWFIVSSGGRKVGYERQVMSQTGDAIKITTELAFDESGGNFDAAEHYLVSVEMKLAMNPRLIAADYRLPGGYHNQGRLVDDGAGKSTWRGIGAWQELKGESPVIKTHQTEIAAAPDLEPDFGVESLARFLPLKPGACRHVTLLNLGAGDLTQRGAWQVHGPEDVEIRGRTVSTTRIDYYTLGRIVRTIWVDPRRHIVRFRRLLYSAFDLEGVASDRAAAIAGVPQELLPRSGEHP